MSESDFTSNHPDMTNYIETNSDTLNMEALSNFSSRKNVIERIISDMVTKEKYTVNINLQNVYVNSEYIQRFIVELMPRIKEIGGNVFVSNNTVVSEEFLKERELI